MDPPERLVRDRVRTREDDLIDPLPRPRTEHPFDEELPDVATTNLDRLDVRHRLERRDEALDKPRRVLLSRLSDLVKTEVLDEFSEVWSRAERLPQGGEGDVVLDVQRPVGVQAQKREEGTADWGRGRGDEGFARDDENLREELGRERGDEVPADDGGSRLIRRDRGIR